MIHVTGLVLVALVLLSAGCAHSYWTKESATNEQFYRDSHACAKDASVAREQVGARVSVYEDLYRGCMLTLGYRRDKYFIQPQSSWRGLSE